MEEQDIRIPTVRGPLAAAGLAIAKVSAGLFAGNLASALFVAAFAPSPSGLVIVLGLVILVGVTWAAVRGINRFFPTSGVGLVPAAIVGRWSQMIEGLVMSPSSFYESFREAIAEKQIPDLEIGEVYAHEGGVFSSKRLYLTVKRGELVYLICGAPFGNGFFVSSWLGPRASTWLILASIMPLGSLMFPWLFRDKTYHEYDTTSMFQSLVHSALTGTVDGMVETKGLRPLTDNDRKPILREFFAN